MTRPGRVLPLSGRKYSLSSIRTGYGHDMCAGIKRRLVGLDLVLTGIRWPLLVYTRASVRPRFDG